MLLVAGAGARSLSVSLTGSVLAKCLLWLPGKVPCPLQQVWSGENNAQGRGRKL